MSAQGQVAVVFVHGFASSARTWDSFTQLMSLDDDLKSMEILPFEYSTQLIRTPFWRLDRSLPTLSTIADSLQTYLEIEAANYERLVIVCHSMGGLVVQRYLQRMLTQGRGFELQRILRIILFATPNAGSDFARKLRRDLLGTSHPQERDLRTLSEEIRDTHAAIIRDVINATESAQGKIPIRFDVFAGTDDKIVPRASAQGTFPKVGALPGDHFSIISPTSRTHRSYTTLRQLLLEVSDDSDPPLKRRTGRARSANKVTPATTIVSEFRADFYGAEWENVYHDVLKQQSSESVSVVDSCFYPGVSVDVIISVRSADSIIQDHLSAERAILNIYAESSISEKKILVGICAIGPDHEDAKRLVFQWLPVEAEGSFYIEGISDSGGLYTIITTWVQNAIRRNSPRMRDGSRIERVLGLTPGPYEIPEGKLL